MSTLTPTYLETNKISVQVANTNPVSVLETQPTPNPRDSFIRNRNSESPELVNTHETTIEEYQEMMLR